jgi:hypothetical protein
MKIRVLILAVILIVVPVISFRFASAQTSVPGCLHGSGETAGQQVRKRQALAKARQINSAEVVAKTQTGTYQPLEQLSRITVDAQGIVAHLAVDANGYAFSIKDSLDPCGFAFFSDQSGIIYQGEALR